MILDAASFVISVILPIVFFLLFIAAVWFLFWRLFLSKFDFIRELFSPGGNGNNGNGSGNGSGSQQRQPPSSSSDSGYTGRVTRQRTRKD